jgi:predicted nucleotidyltransferase
MEETVQNQASFAMQDELARIARRYRLSSLYVFGSREKEVAELVRQKAGSLKRSTADVDIAVLPQPSVTLTVREKIEIILELEQLFDAPRVDLVVLPEADPFLTVNAIRGERIYCDDQHRADEYELYILRRGGDLLPLERERIRIIMGDEG